MKSRKLTWFAAMTLFAALAIPVRLAAQVAGSGTPGRIPIWTGSTTPSNTLGNSVIFQAGGKVGIRTNPTATLTVVGPNAAPVQNAQTVLNVIGGIGGSSEGHVGGPGTGAAIQLVSGTGGLCSVDTPCTLGANGGLIQLTGGNGGAGFLGGGIGALVNISAGSGGQGVGNGGVGGSLNLIAGTGGNTIGGDSDKGGNGGSITLQPGAGGTGPLSSQSGRPGSIILAPNGGKVGIGETSPANTLEVKVGGTTLADAWSIRSSRRFKTNIQPLEGALQKVEQLQGVSYQRKADGKHEIGVVAEDVAQIVPEVVSRDPNTHEVQGVDYSRLAALLIEAVKSQQAEIRQLKVRIEQLTSKAPGK
jgi:hypothetical protein